MHRTPLSDAIMNEQEVSEYYLVACRQCALTKQQFGASGDREAKESSQAVVSRSDTSVERTGDSAVVRRRVASSPGPALRPYASAAAKSQGKFRAEEESRGDDDDASKKRKKSVAH